jgi:methyltransferase (TIGR00027 family)
MDGMDVGRASRTAVFVFQGRAAAHGRLAVGRFDDPVAAQLLHPAELVAVEQAKSAIPPENWRERLVVESIRGYAEVVVPRTVAIDDAIREAGHSQVVIVGAGLDSRPWRLAELRGAVVFAVDQPASQADARQRGHGLPPTARQLVFVPVDLTRERLDDALAGTGHDPQLPTTWVWEGVVPYLTAAEVDTAVGAISTRSAPRSVLVVNYQSPSRVAGLGRRLAGVAARLSGQDNPLADEPWRSSWTAETMRALLARHRFTVSRDEDLLAIAARIVSPTRNRRSVGIGRVAVATT